ncbi:hypothetical protein M1O19_05085 [Dehalococcoidia bacterium]|nr:hypothetical protein [Dehalococcoidia bacterium]MCL0070836.1 hypothetical protein [Dehalococcoidia bacterium]MCL0097877.1 hypothetical protein [Dehalococcoidia bacterium]
MILPEKRSEIILVSLIALLMLFGLAGIIEEAFDQPISIKDMLIPIHNILLAVFVYLLAIKKIIVKSQKKTLPTIFMIGLIVLMLAVGLLWSSWQRGWL